MTRILLGLFILKILSLASSYESEIGELMFSCPDGWTIHFGNCYMFVNMHAQHRVADNVCKRYGSKLANPKDDNELDYLKQKAKFRFINETKFWIGYSNDSHGYRDNFQPNWSEGKCVAMTIDDGLYLVDKCFKPYSFVCQKEAYSGVNCPAGYYNATATSCLPCEKGKYKNSVGNSECTSCPNSVYTTTATGSTSANNCTEVNCPAGYKYNSSSETCVVCPKGTYQTKRGNYPCVSCPGILTTFRKASTSENDCLILNCPAGYYNATATSCLPCEKGKYKNSVGNSECTSCPNSVYTTTATGSTSANNCTEVNCPAGYKYNSSSETCIVCPKGTYQTKRGNYPCVSCPGILTTFRKASTSENDCLIPPDPNVLSTAEMSISLQYTFVNCEMNQAFYEKQIKEMMAERIKELSKNYNLCSGSCELTVSINCPVSKRKKRATTRGDAKIQVGNIKADTDSTFTNEIRKTENLFREDCKLNSGQYKLESSAMLGCVVETTCTYSKLVSKECVKCPAGTKATVTGCVDCPNGTYSALDQRTCINCTYPLTSKPRSNSSSQCLAECLVNPDYCKHGGICSRGVHDLYHSCYCPIKYSGNQCEIYYEPHDPKQKWIYVGIGCIAAILVLILIVVITVIHLRKKREEEKKHDSKLDEEPFTDPFYGLPVQGYRKNKSFVSPWKDVGKF